MNFLDHTFNDGVDGIPSGHVVAPSASTGYGGLCYLGTL